MNITDKNIEFEVDSKTYHAYMAWDADNQEPAPGIMVIHEWWGLNDYPRRRANMLAEQGFVGFAIDMYGNGQTADNPDQAGTLMNSVLDDMESGTMCLQAAFQTMKGQDEVDGLKTAAIGYCFGGAMALHMARIGMDISAAVSFHGALGSFHKPQAGAVKASILVCHGEDDAMVSMDDVASFKSEMEEAGANYEVLVHPGAEHGFSNLGADEKNEKFGLPVRYQSNADNESWLAMMALFERCF